MERCHFNWNTQALGIVIRDEGYSSCNVRAKNRSYLGSGRGRGRYDHSGEHATGVRPNDRLCSRLDVWRKRWPSLRQQLKPLPQTGCGFREALSIVMRDEGCNGCNVRVKNRNYYWNGRGSDHRGEDAARIRPTGRLLSRLGVNNVACSCGSSGTYGP
jgi:hypothetical protein